MDGIYNTIVDTSLAVAISLYLLKFFTDKFFRFITEEVMRELREISETQERTAETLKNVSEQLKAVSETTKEILILIRQYDKGRGVDSG